MKLINFSYLFLAASLFITGCQIPNSGELEIGDAFGNETQTRGYGAKISALPTSDGTIADTDDLLINDYSESRTESIDASQLKTYFQTGLDASVLDLTDDYTWTGASDFSGSTVTLPATVSGGLTSFEVAGAAATVQSDVDTNESDADAAIALKANTADTYTQTAADAAIATSISNLLSGDPVFAGNVGFDDTPEFSAGLEATFLEFSGGSDATITRSAAGVIAVEGVDVLTTSTGYTQTAADAAFEVAGAAATVQSDVDQNESDAEAAFLTSSFSQRGIRSVGSTHALEMPARDFALDNHSVRGVFKRPTTDTVLWTNQQQDTIATSAWRKSGGAGSISSAGATGFTASGAVTATTGNLAPDVVVGQTIRFSFNVDVAASISNIRARYYSGGFITMSNEVTSGFVDGANTIDLVATVARTSSWEIQITLTDDCVVSVTSTNVLREPLGSRLIWQQDGKLKLQFGNLTDWATLEWVSDASASVAVGDYAEIIASINRDDDELIFFVNGLHMQDSGAANEYHDISAASAQTLTTKNTWLLFSDGSTHYAGSAVEAFCFDAGAILASVVAERFADPTLWLDSTATSETIGIWDWSVGFDSWTEVRLTGLAGQTIGGEGDWLKLTPSVDNNNHEMTLNPIGTVSPSGTYMKLKFKVYIPSGQAQNINQIRARFFNLAGTAGQVVATRTPTKDQIMSYEIDFVTTEEAGKFYLYVFKDSTESYTGDATSHLYVKDVELYKNGLDRAVDLRASGLTKPDRIGSDDGDYVTASGITDTDPLTIN